MQTPRGRFLAGAVMFLLAATLAACGESQQDPMSPVTPSFDKKLDVTSGPALYVATSTLWDFAAIIPGAGDPEDLGTSETIQTSDVSDGSIVATTGASNQHLTVKGRGLPPGDPERGLGLCLTDQATCIFPDDGDEVGDGGYGALFLDFDGVQPAGSRLEMIELGSVQVDEGYSYSISTDGGSTFGPVTTLYDGDANANATVVIDMPTAGLVVKLEKAPDIAANDNDYTVKSVTTSYSSDETMDGRMTGGGVKAMGDDEEVVTLGLTLHCDIKLSNNLEVNWKGHQWHLAKPIESAMCTNEGLGPEPPAAPIDTFEGTAYGRLDGVGNSFIEFRFQDAGEPGRDDTIEMTIYEPGSMSDVALQVSFQTLNVGNFQMHYDQPHGQKP